MRHLAIPFRQLAVPVGMQGGGARAPWYLTNGLVLSDCIAAYLPEFAASLAASYANLPSPGTYDATPGTEPAWDATNGWKFTAASKHYLTLGFTPDANYSVLLKINSLSGNSRVPYAAQTVVNNTFNMFLSGGNVDSYWRIDGHSMTYNANLDTGTHRLGIIGGKTWAGGTAGCLYVDGKFVGYINVGAQTPTYSTFTVGREGDVDNYYFQGNIQRLAIYGRSLNVLQAQFILGDSVASPGWATGIRGIVNQHVSLGNELQKERTDSWTWGAAFALNSLNYSTLLFSNVPTPGPAYPGYELFVDTNGKLHVRLINSWSAARYIGVIGSTHVCDGRKHVVWWTYDGSGAAAGVKIYLDGVLETMTTESDTLGENSIVDGAQDYTIASQAGMDATFYWDGVIGWVMQYDAVKDQTFVTANSGGAIPDADANCELRLPFSERSGTVAADTSGNGNDATLTSASMWQ